MPKNNTTIPVSAEDRVSLVLDVLRGVPLEEVAERGGILVSKLENDLDTFIRFGKAGFTRNRECQADDTSLSAIFSSILVSMPHAVFCKDLDGNFIYGNPAYCKAVKTSLQDLIGKNDFDIHSDEAATKYIQDDQRVIETGGVFSCEEENILQSGQARWTRVIKVPLRNLTGELIGIMGVFWDVTQQKMLDLQVRNSHNNLEKIVEIRTAELLEANRRLEESARLQSQFLSSVSHELRTPLTSIMGFSKIIGRDAAKIAPPTLPPENQGRFSRIEDNACIIGKEALRLKRLIDDLLDFGKIESGEMTWADERCDITRVAKDSVNTIRGQFVAIPNVELLAEFPPDPIYVLADPDRLKQIFINLLSNAAKFTTDGHVKLSLRIVQDRWVEALVEDTGIGISETDLSRIFDDYYQVVNKGLNAGGTGLGLSICRQIISHYDGKFWAESSAGKGTTLFFRLKLDTEQKAIKASAL